MGPSEKGQGSLEEAPGPSCPFEEASTSFSGVPPLTMTE